jgi:SAM-dependent methyltransferase
MALSPVYDDIGRGYAARRQHDRRMADVIRAGLGGARSVLNGGAGTGSYEPNGLRVLAVDPSCEMIRQRPRSAAPTIGATAEDLPFRDGSFDATLAVLTIHHWTDLDGGLRELRRVTRDRAVIVTWDPAARDAFWLTAHYLPEVLQFDVGRFPSLDVFARYFTDVDVQPLLIPHDCDDGFLGAFWRRPEAYLIPGRTARDVRLRAASGRRRRRRSATARRRSALGPLERAICCVADDGECRSRLPSGGGAERPQHETLVGDSTDKDGDLRWRTHSGSRS